MPKTYFYNKPNTINAFNEKVDTSKKINVLSLFSGCGGMDLGFEGGFEYLNQTYEKNPFDIIFSNDIFKEAADSYEANFNKKVERRSISDLSESELPDKPVDVILGGFPCQSFSLAGKREGLSDPRGQLYLQMIRIINHYQPKMFIAENVDGIRNSRKNVVGEDINRSALDTILGDFNEANYDVQYHVLNSADYGVPQTRRRVIIMGIRKDLGSIEDEFYPEKLYSQDNSTGMPWRTAFDGIEDIYDEVNNPQIPNHTSRDISKAKFYPGKKMQGNNRIARDRPSPTIRSEHHGNIEAHYNTIKTDENDMSGWRRLSVRECARLQSFPDSYVFVSSASSAYKAIGNAVPPVMAWHIARAVHHTLQNLKK